MDCQCLRIRQESREWELLFRFLLSKGKGRSLIRNTDGGGNHKIVDGNFPYTWTTSEQGVDIRRQEKKWDDLTDGISFGPLVIRKSKRQDEEQRVKECKSRQERVRDDNILPCRPFTNRVKEILTQIEKRVNWVYTEHTTQNEERLHIQLKERIYTMFSLETAGDTDWFWCTREAGDSRENTKNQTEWQRRRTWRRTRDRDWLCFFNRRTRLQRLFILRTGFTLPREPSVEQDSQARDLEERERERPESMRTYLASCDPHAVLSAGRRRHRTEF